MRRLLIAAAAGAAVGTFATLLLLIAYVVGKLWLAGHGREPPGYDTWASAVVFGGGLIAAAFSFRAVWRARAPGPSSETR